MLTQNKSVTNLKEVTQLVADFNYLDVASLLHAVSDAIRQGQTLGDTLEELGVDIKGITDGGCGLLPNIKDVVDEMELINLAGVCTARLLQSYQIAC
ncbi:hypothetical protein HW132_28300 [Brasilonema sp. CT11]|nr:hypothetical protein [Brasilonema sp. CT11]